MWRVLRIRVPSYLLDGTLPNGVAKDLKGNFVGYLVESPSYLHAADIDFYVSEREPYWPAPDGIRKHNAAMGPLRNQAGQVLTAVSQNHSMAHVPTPGEPHLLEPMGVDDAMRGIVLTIERPGGFAWLVEAPVSRTAFADLSRYRSPKVAPTLLNTPIGPLSVPRRLGLIRNDGLL